MAPGAFRELAGRDAGRAGAAIVSVRVTQG